MYAIFAYGLMQTDDGNFKRDDVINFSFITPTTNFECKIFIHALEYDKQFSLLETGPGLFSITRKYTLGVPTAPKL